MTGTTSYHGGLAAESIVALTYERDGRPIVNRRWRGRGGEIDLIAKDGEGFIFVEVKKSGDFDRAAQRLRRHQMDRLCATAAEFVGGQPLGQSTEMRFDLALVNASGEVQIIKNAFMEA